MSSCFDALRRASGWSRVVRRLVAMPLFVLPMMAAAASSAVQYSYDAAGNLVGITRQAAAGLAITSFDPTAAAVGAAVTIYGTGFSATPANNVVKFNGTTATVSASASGSISTTVPTGASSGRITVTVGGVTATSSTDFTVVIPGAPTIASFSPASGAAGTTVTVNGTNFTAGTTTTLNSVATSAPTIASTTSLTFQVPPDTASGRIVATNAAGSGSSAQDFLVPPPGATAAEIAVMKRVVTGSAPTSIAINPGSKGLLLFDGTAGIHYTLQLSPLAISPSVANVAYTLVKPDNTVFATGNVGGTNRPTIHLPKLPASGTYSILLVPGSATFNSNVKIAADPVIPVDGSATAVALDAASQTARVVFDAAAGQRIGLGILGFTATPTPSVSSYLKTYAPDGTTVIDTTTCNIASSQNLAGNCDADLVATGAGRYATIFEVASGSTGSFSVQLSSELGGALTADSGSDTTLTRVGQDGRHTFTAAAGDSFGLALTQTSAGQSQAQSFVAKAFQPNGTLLDQLSVTPPGVGYLELGALAAGTYAISLDPTVGAYGTYRLTLKRGPLLATTDASPTPFAPATVGEVARLRVAATAGETLTVAVTGLTNVSGGGWSGLYLYGPSRSQIGSGLNCFTTSPAGSCRVAFSAPSTGTYSIVVLPPAGTRISGNAAVIAPLTGTLTNGVTQAINATKAGQHAAYTFSATAGSGTAVKLFSVSTSPSGQDLKVTVLRPDGVQLASAMASAGTPVILPLNPVTTGTHTVLVEPTYAVTWQGSLQLDAGTAVTVDGTAPSVASPSTNEPLRFTFTGTAGQFVNIGIGGITYSPTSSSSTGLGLFAPNAMGLVGSGCTTAVGTCEVQYYLGSSGTHAVHVVPPAGVTLSGGTLAVSNPLPGTFVIGDPAQTVSITRPGQTARYIFTATSGQTLRINWSSVAISGGNSAQVQVQTAGGSLLAFASVANGASGGLDIPAISSTGTYAIVVDPASGASFSASMTLVTR